jgi:LAGLIDADG DNA endonuclease family/AP2 domain
MRLSYYIDCMTNAFSIDQQQIIDGSLLGDAYIDKPKKGNSCFSKCQSDKHREYLEWHMEALGDLSCSIKEYDNYACGKKYRKVVYRAFSNEAFTELRKKWYPEGKKIVPGDLTLTPLIIAIWFFDDGSNYLHKRLCKFHTNAFCQSDCEMLMSQLRDHGIGSKYYRKEIYIHPDSYRTLVELVAPYMKWDCFKHKIQYRDVCNKPTYDDEAIAMVEMYKKGHTLKEISKVLDKSINVVSDVLNGKRKKHLGISIGKSGLALNNTSGIKGIAWDKSRDKWNASFKLGNRSMNIGRFDDKEEAAIQKNKAKENLSRVISKINELSGIKDNRGWWESPNSRTKVSISVNSGGYSLGLPTDQAKLIKTGTRSHYIDTGPVMDPRNRTTVYSFEQEDLVVGNAVDLIKEYVIREDCD